VSKKLFVVNYKFRSSKFPIVLEKFILLEVRTDTETSAPFIILETFYLPGGVLF